MFNSNIINKVAQVLVSLGAINWGAALFDYNIVTALLGAFPIAVKLVYGLIGASGVIELLNHLGLGMKDHN